MFMNCMCVYVLSVIAAVSLTQAVSRSQFFVFDICIHHTLILLGHIDHDTCCEDIREMYDQGCGWSSGTFRLYKLGCSKVSFQYSG